MIAKVTRGWRAGGLVRYLMGPGRANEHTNQRVVAVWDGQPELHQPAPNGRGGFDVAELIAELTDPAVAAGVPQVEPADTAGSKRQRGPVWHCSLRNHATDRLLSDAEWAAVVEEVMDRTGIARRGDLGACRWVAIRHATDHVHIAAVLVRQDTGRRVHPYRDYLRAGEVCREAEARLGLTLTPPADRTAVGQSTRAEMEKATRHGKAETSRAWLRRSARLAAVRARDPQGYFRALADLGVLARPRHNPAGEVYGYAVAAPGDVTAAGRPVWYSGRSLGRDLTLPQLRRRWASAPAPIPPAPGERSRVGKAERDGAVDQALAALEHAIRTMRAGARATAGRGNGADAAADAVIHATEDMLNAVGAVTEPGRRPALGGAADTFQRAARTPRVGQPTRWSPAAAQLRTAAWRLIGVRALPAPPGISGDAVRLIAALAALLAEIAAYQQAQHRLAQAKATQTSHHALTTRRPPNQPEIGRTGPPRGPARLTQTPTVAGAVQNPARDYLRRTRQRGSGRGRDGPGLSR